MSTLSTLIDPASEQFRANAAHNAALADELRSRVATAALGGSAQHRERHGAKLVFVPVEEDVGADDGVSSGGD